MKQILMAFAAALVSSTFALADTPVTPAEGEKIKAALEAFGCTGGKMEKETEGSYQSPVGGRVSRPDVGVLRGSAAGLQPS
jgi:hypothetical protein